MKKNSEIKLFRKFDNLTKPILQMAFLFASLFLTSIYSLANSQGGEIRTAIENAQQSTLNHRAEALKFYQNGNYEKAIEIWTELLRSNPTDPSVINNIGIAYRQLGQSERAIDYLQKAIKISPNYSHSYYSLGLAYYDLRNYEKAKEAFEEAIKLKYRLPASYFNLGLSFYCMGDYGKAQESFLEAIELGYDLGPSYYQLGSTKYRLEDYKGAAEAFEKAIKNNASNPGIHYYLGRCYLELRKPYAARRAFKKECGLKTEFSAEASKEIAKAEEKILTQQAKILGIIAIPAIPFLMLIFLRKKREFYKPNMRKVILLSTFLLFLPIPFLLIAIWLPPLVGGILLYPYVYSSILVVGFPSMASGLLAYIGFLFSLVYLTAMVFLIYWIACSLYKIVKNKDWLWAVMGIVISISFLNIYWGAIVGKQSRTNWIEMIRTIYSTIVL